MLRIVFFGIFIMIFCCDRSPGDLGENKEEEKERLEKNEECKHSFTPFLYIAV